MQLRSLAYYDGDLMSLNDFKECCQSGSVSNDYGSGYFATGSEVSNIRVDCRFFKYMPDNYSPLIVIEGQEFTYVMWFNK